ncbi:threonine-phosphate decarboxylase [Mycobacterium parmense]|nr:Rv2231c family pyridoxal phosphate-dependent protein CobC [Mycobacterium parmense]MCV7349808.1 threonine-phosphate decarboxylase [Mycobacterium parmense]
MPSAESVSVPSRSKITSCGGPVTSPLSWIAGSRCDGAAAAPSGGPTTVSRMASLNLSPPATSRYHGDEAVAPGMLDFAVNVRHAQPPEWLVRRLAARLPDLARYPGAQDEQRARDAVAARHGRTREEVLPLAGAAEGFALLRNLRPARAAIVAPAFTEPAAALTAAGVPVHHVVLEPPFGLRDIRVPDDADLVVVGNPTNPTSVLHTREQLLALRRPGRILVVDEAFADSVPGEPGSLAADPMPDVLVLRSLTKTWALAGLRVGYALGSPELLARLTSARAHWPLGTLQLAAIGACCEPQAVGDAAADAERLAALRAEMAAGLTAAGAEVVDGRAPFVLFRAPEAVLIRTRLHDRGIAIRRCDTFVGLDESYLRAAVRAEWPLLAQVIAEVRR